MTAYLQLDTTRSSLTMDLFDGTFYVSDEGFEIDFTDEESWLVFTLKSTDTAANNRTAMRTLDAIYRTVKKYQEFDHWNDSCWITWRSDGEGNKRALVTDMTYKMISQATKTPLLTSGGAFLELAIKHLGWEDGGATTSYSLNLTNMDHIGDYYYNSSAQGSATKGGRLSVTVTPQSGAGFTKVWVGIREKNNGATNFNPLIECESGTTQNSSTITTDTNAHPGGAGNTCIETSFATTNSLVSRMHVSLGAITSYETEYYGKYLILVRMRNVSTAVTRVQLHYGLSTDTHSLKGEVYVQGTNYLFYPMGFVSIPPVTNKGSAFGYSGADLYGDEIDFALWATRLSGSGEMRFDCIVLMPAEHLGITESSVGIGLGGSYAAISKLENGQILSKQRNTAGYEIVVPETIDWDIPPAEWVLVLAANLDTASQLSNYSTVAVSVRDTFQSFES